MLSRCTKHQSCQGQSVGSCTTPTMAAHRSVALALELLLGVLLDMSSGQGPACVCGTTEMDDCFGAPCTEVHCSSIEDATGVQCAEEFLTNVTSLAPSVPIRVVLSSSDLTVFPDDFLASYDVIAIELNACPMTEVPHRLIDPTCGTLLDLEIYECSTLPALLDQEFSACPNLQKLYLVGDGIATVPQTAFVGLGSLQSLYLQENQLTSFGGFQGLQGLAILDLSVNQLASVAKDAFQGLGQLAVIALQDNGLTTLEQGTFDPLLNTPVTVTLEGNPLNCDCNLKWLQDWVLANDTDQQATCATPVEGPLVDADFSACSSARFPRKSRT